MNRRAFFKTSGAALGLLAVGQAGRALPTSAQADALDGDSITPDMRARRPRRIRYQNSDLRVDLGVGLWGWPLPMDYNGDGLMDLVVAGSGTLTTESTFSRIPG